MTTKTAQERARDLMEDMAFDFFRPNIRAENLIAAEFEADAKRIEELVKQNKQLADEYMGLWNGITEDDDRIADLEAKLAMMNAHDKSRVNCLLKVEALEAKLRTCREALKGIIEISMSGGGDYEETARQALSSTEDKAGV